jgi:phospholipid/cholesterol/gamma-HCH transport system substrate-binding protein
MMESKREQALVGLFVLIAGAMLIATVFAMSGVFGRTTHTYHANFSFAGGIEPGTTVRYAGGPKVGHVDKVRLDAQDSSRLDITFSVQSDLPIKTDSRVKIMSMSPLGDNHLEILPGSPQAFIAPNGSLLPSENYLDFNALVSQVNDIAPQARELVHSLNDRATELKETIVRVNDLLSAQNRANLSATLSTTRGMIEENRPQVKSTLQNLNTVSQRVGPLLEDFRKTADEARKTLDHIDSLIGDNRTDIRKAVMELRRALSNVTEVTAHLDQTLDVNSERLEDILANMQRVTENLKEFTATIKTQPSSLIRATNSREHKPGEQP